MDIKIFKNVVTALLAFSLFIILLSCTKAESNDLFTPVSLEKARLEEEQENVMTKIKQEKTTAELRIVTINLKILERDSVNLNVFPEKNFTAVRKKIEKRTENDFTWFGKTDDAFDSVILVVRDNNMTGTIRVGSELYRVRPLGAGKHAVIHVDQSKFPPDHPPEFEEIMKKKSDLKSKMEKSIRGKALKRNGEIIYNVIVAYTPAAEAAVPDIDATIQLAIDETNQSYDNSDVNVAVVLAYSYRVNYTESGSFYTDLTYFRNSADGRMDEVHTLRHQYAADVAILIINNPAYCGLASVIMADSYEAFAAVHYSCATGYYSFAHEIGHLQGARHNPEADPTTTPFPYGHGYYYVPGQWRTIMSYNCPGGCTRLPFWSNPNITHNGVPMGTVATHDNARVLDETADIIAWFKREIYSMPYLAPLLLD